MLPSAFWLAVHPVALQFGPFTITWYGVLAALGFLTGLWTASRRGLRVGITGERIVDLGPWLIAGALVGARTLFVISYWHEEFAGHPWVEILKVWRGGLVFYGGFIGASLACLFYSLWHKLPVWRVADVLAPSIALGSAFGRVGCLMNGCCYGRVCNLPWAIHYPIGHLTYPHAVHPTQIYDALLNLCLYGFLAWLFRHRRFEGQVFAAYLIGYALARSFVEIFRGDYPQYYLGGWATPAQVVSLGIIAAGIALFTILPRVQPAAADSKP